MVPHIGFEPMISALRGRCPGPLDECGPVSAGRSVAQAGRHDSSAAAGASNDPGPVPRPPTAGSSPGTREPHPPPADSWFRPAPGRNANARQTARTSPRASRPGARNRPTGSFRPTNAFQRNTLLEAAATTHTCLHLSGGASLTSFSTTSELSRVRRSATWFRMFQCMDQHSCSGRGSAADSM